MNPAELHMLTGAYAVHALSDAESAEFRRHLVVCEACAQEVRELRATAARLGTATAVTTTDEMKDRVLARIANVRQLPPDVGAPPPQPRGAASRGGRFTRFALAACLVGALVAGTEAVLWYRAAGRAESAAAVAQQREERLTALMGAPDAVSASTAVTGGGSGMIVLSRSRDETALVAGGLRELPESRTYQLWFADGGTMRSAGLLPPGRNRGSTVLIAPGVGGASGVGLTVEPAGGSQQPTSDPVMLLDFPA